MRGRNRETLVLLELAIVLLVFAVFAAGCLRIFAAAREIARESNDLHRAAEWAQSAAECFKALGGDPKETLSFYAWRMTARATTRPGATLTGRPLTLKTAHIFEGGRRRWPRANFRCQRW